MTKDFAHVKRLTPTQSYRSTAYLKSCEQEMIKHKCVKQYRARSAKASCYAPVEARLCCGISSWSDREHQLPPAPLEEEREIDRDILRDVR